CHQGNNIPGTF
nr:immunoglobulin light chain junction region [Macaca mulatta]